VSPPPPLPELEIRPLGLVDYEDGLRAQEVLAAAVRAGELPDQLLLLHHPPVVTLGRGARDEHLLAAPARLAALGVERFRIDRGGQVTYHDPGQIVGYPILRVSELRPQPRPGESAPLPGGAQALVWGVEELLLRALGELGLQPRRRPEYPGVWLPQGKAAAVGLRIERDVSRHGFALNCSTDPGAWGLIVPCGLRGEGVVSLAQALGQAPARAGLERRLAELAGQVWGRRLHWSPPERASIQTLVYRSEPRLELLLLHRVPERGGFWQPVTGMIEPGETPADCARRELREETGLTPLAWHDLDYVHSFLVEPGLRPDSPRRPSFLREHSFAARVGEGEPRIDPREHDAWRWVGLEEALAMLRWSGNRRAARLAAGCG